MIAIKCFKYKNKALGYDYVVHLILTKFKMISKIKSLKIKRYGKLSIFIFNVLRFVENYGRMSPLFAVRHVAPSC